MLLHSFIGKGSWQSAFNDLVNASSIDSAYILRYCTKQGRLPRSLSLLTSITQTVATTNNSSSRYPKRCRSQRGDIKMAIFLPAGEEEIASVAASFATTNNSSSRYPKGAGRARRSPCWHKDGLPRPLSPVTARPFAAGNRCFCIPLWQGSWRSALIFVPKHLLCWAVIRIHVKHEFSVVDARKMTDCHVPFLRSLV